MNKDGEYVLPFDVEDAHLEQCSQWLDKCVVGAENLYDPYQAAFNSSNTMPNAVKIAELEGSTVTEYNKMLDDLIIFRQKAMSTPPLNRLARIYHKKY